MQDYPRAMLHHKLLVSAVNGQWGVAYNKPSWLGHVPPIDFFLGCESRSCSHLSYLQFISLKNKHQLLCDVWMVQGQPTRPQKTQSITSKVRERQQRMAGVGGKHSWIVQEWCCTAWTFEAQGRGCWPRGAPGRGSWCWGAEGTENGHTPVPWKKYACRRFLLIGSLGFIPQSIFIQSYMCICRWFCAYVYYGLFLNHPTLRDSKSYRDFKRWCGGQPPVLGPAYHICCSWF